MKPRRRLALTISVTVAAVLAIAAAVGYFLFFRVSTRGPGDVASGTAIEFALPDQLGETTTLAGLLRRGPAVLVFYRGHW